MHFEKRIQIQIQNLTFFFNFKIVFFLSLLKANPSEANSDLTQKNNACSTPTTGEDLVETEPEKNSFRLDESFANDEMNPLHFQVKNLQRLLVDEQG